MKHVPGRVIVKADKDGKNWHTFSDGTKIRVERQYNNLDRKHTEQVLGMVVSAENIPEGAMVLFHHNCIHPVNQIFNSSQLSGEEIANGASLYSFKEEECYLWKMPGEKEWKPNKNFAIGLYIYKKYQGPLLGVEPKKMEDILYIAKSNRFEGFVCQCLKAVGMPIIFLNDEGVEQTVIRLRVYDEDDDRQEVIAVNEHYTDMVKSGELLVGTSIKDCKKLNEYYV